MLYLENQLTTSIDDSLLGPFYVKTFFNFEHDTKTKKEHVIMKDHINNSSKANQKISTDFYLNYLTLFSTSPGPGDGGGGGGGGGWRWI